MHALKAILLQVKQTQMLHQNLILHTRFAALRYPLCACFVRCVMCVGVRCVVRLEKSMQVIHDPGIPGHLGTWP